MLTSLLDYNIIFNPKRYENKGGKDEISLKALNDFNTRSGHTRP